MTKIIDTESIPSDDPFFKGSVELFSKLAVEPEKLKLPPSWTEGAAYSQPDSTWAVRFAYFRGRHPKDALEHTKLDDKRSSN